MAFSAPSSPTKQKRSDTKSTPDFVADADSSHHIRSCEIAKQLTWGVDVSRVIDLREEASHQYPTTLLPGTETSGVFASDIFASKAPPTAQPMPHRALGLSAKLRAIALLITVFTGALLPFASLTHLRFVFALCFLSFVPGATVFATNRTLERSTIAIFSVALSLVISGTVATLMLETKNWHPTIAYGILAFLALIRIGPTFRNEKLRLSFPKISKIHARYIAGPSIAILLWTHALLNTSVQSLDDYGLTRAFPPSYYLALFVLAISFVFAIAKKRNNWILSAHIVVLIFILHATAAILYSAPRYGWTFKHIGATDFLAHTGAVHTNVDIYNNWPFFFALCAWLQKLGGLELSLRAAWAQLFFNLCNFGLLWVLYRNLVSSYRTRWIAIGLFFCGSWTAQDYFAPQAFAFTLSLAFFTFALPYLHTPKGVLQPIAKHISRRIAYSRGTETHAFNRRNYLQRSLRAFPFAHLFRQREKTFAPVASALSRRWSLCLALCFGAAIVASHQLTPIILLLQLGALTVLRYIRRWWFVATLAVIDLAYIYPHLTYVRQHFGLFNTSAVKDAPTTIDDMSAALPGRIESTQASLALAALLAVLAIIGLIRRLRTNKTDLTYAILAAMPITVLLAQDYGGEGIIRSYLMALPWLALLGAYTFLPLRTPWANKWFLPATAMLTAITCLCLLVSAYFGNDGVNEMRRTEVIASEWILDNAPNDSGIFTVNSNFPVRANRNYARFVGPKGGDSWPNLRDFQSLTNRPSNEWTVENVRLSIEKWRLKHNYIVFSTSQQKWSQIVGAPNLASYRTLYEDALHSPRAQVVYQNSDAVIVEIR